MRDHVINTCKFSYKLISHFSNFLILRHLQDIIDNYTYK